MSTALLAESAPRPKVFRVRATMVAESPSAIPSVAARFRVDFSAPALICAAVMPPLESSSIAWAASLAE